MGPDQKYCWHPYTRTSKEITVQMTLHYDSREWRILTCTLSSEERPGFGLREGYSERCHLSRTGSEADMRCLPVFPSSCVSWSSQHLLLAFCLLGMGFWRDGVWLIPILCPYPFFLPACPGVSHPWGRAGGPRRSPERGGGLVSLVAVPDGEHSCRTWCVPVVTRWFCVLTGLCPEKLAFLNSCLLMMVLSCSSPILGCPGPFPE